MPLYEYRCSCCGKTSERIYHWKKVPKQNRCSYCGEKTKRIYTARVSIKIPGGICGWVDFAGNDPMNHDRVKVGTKAELDREAKKRGLVVDAI